MALIPLSSRPCRAVVNKTAVFAKKRLPPISWCGISRCNTSFNQRYFSYSGKSPSDGEEKHAKKYSYNHQQPIQKSTSLKRAEWEKNRQRKHHQYLQRKKHDAGPSLIQSSQYTYKIRCGKDAASTPDSSCASQNTKGNNAASTVMKSMNASALLDPLKYCKGSGKLIANVNNGGRTINGADAARRLSRGKKDFLSAARELDGPVVLDGHGVPPALFQHCADMADALLRYYGPDVVECSFHNYHSTEKNTSSSGKTPLHVRVRRRDGTNSCLPPPSISERNRDGKNHGIEGREMNRIDWDYNLTLYLTVMERLAKNLGQVLELSTTRNDRGQTPVQKESLSLGGNTCVDADESSDENDGEDGDDDFVDSPVFGALPKPRWNVDILRGAYFDFQPNENGSASTITNDMERWEQKRKATNKNPNDDKGEGGHNGHTIDGIRPFPVVEFVQQQSSRSSGNVLIRLQGCPLPNEEFGDARLQRLGEHLQQPVTLVFDACFQAPLREKAQVH